MEDISNIINICVTSFIQALTCMDLFWKFSRCSSNDILEVSEDYVTVKSY